MMGILHGPSETLWTTTIKVGLTDLLLTGSDTGDRLPPTAGQTGSVRGQCWHVPLRQLLWVIRRVGKFLLPLPSTNFHLTAPLPSLINAGEITVSARLSRTYDWLAIVCRNPICAESSAFRFLILHCRTLVCLARELNWALTFKWCNTAEEVVLPGPLVPKDLRGDNNPPPVVWLGCTVAANRKQDLCAQRSAGGRVCEPQLSEWIRPASAPRWREEAFTDVSFW